MILTVGELKKELQHYPEDWKVMISIKGEETFATGINMDVAKIDAWITIDDYPKRDDTKS